MASDSRKYVSKGPTVLLVPLAQVQVLTTMMYLHSSSPHSQCLDLRISDLRPEKRQAALPKGNCSNEVGLDRKVAGL